MSTDAGARTTSHGEGTLGDSDSDSPNIMIRIRDIRTDRNDVVVISRLRNGD